MNNNSGVTPQVRSSMSRGRTDGKELKRSIQPQKYLRNAVSEMGMPSKRIRSRTLTRCGDE